MSQPRILSDAELALLHSYQLEMGRELKRICEAHGISYFLVAGSLLGAVRHDGFIPWDDDMDFGMLRADYEQFVRVAQEDMDSRFSLQTWDTDPYFGLPIAKIRRNDSRLIEEISEVVPAHQGIFIDIFPFDQIPDGRALRLMQNVVSSVLKRLIIWHCGYVQPSASGSFRRSIFVMGRAVSRWVSLDLMRRLLEWIMKCPWQKSGESVVAFGGAHGYQKETVARAWVEELTALSFEGQTFPGTLHWSAYLHNLYGDFMSYPPARQRGEGHGIVDLQFPEPPK
ncbi:LicD family protein [Arthrobacter rhombi]|uniref:LicD family protein n=1 Tax=Arthrobacter rhombi TaxID=71253 RepID=UPI003FCEF190